ncbi:MAG: hypothetical protein LBD08_07335 [Treponema sp.]|jgi:hypothetical protein|nr:hypothetical protein [Treponema sp.]
MWFTEEVLKDINELLFFANTPGYIVDGLRRKNVLNILKLSHNNKDEVINEIKEHIQCISTNVYGFSYVYILVVYLETSFSNPFIDDLDYKYFMFLKDVIKIVNNGSKETYQVVNVQHEPPKVILHTGGL